MATVQAPNRMLSAHGRGSIIVQPTSGSVAPGAKVRSREVCTRVATVRSWPILLKHSGSELVQVLQGNRRFGIAQARGDSHLWRHPASGDLASATDLFVALHRPNTRSTPKSSPPKIRVFQQNRQDLPLARTPESSPKRSCGERVPMSCPTDPGQVPANGPPRAQSPEIGIREC